MPEIPPSAYSGMLLSSKCLELARNLTQKGQIVHGPEYQASNINTEGHYQLLMVPLSILQGPAQYYLFQKPILNMLKETALSSSSLQFAFLDSLSESQLLHPENMINITYLEVFLRGLSEITFIKCQVAVFST